MPTTTLPRTRAVRLAASVCTGLVLTVGAAAPADAACDPAGLIPPGPGCPGQPPGLPPAEPGPMPPPPVTHQQPQQPQPPPVPAHNGHAPATTDRPAQSPISQPAASDQLLDLINQERRAAGLPALRASSLAADIATAHSQAMATARRIWHNAAYFTDHTKTALGARTLGENVALNTSLHDAHRRLIASPGHRANILNPSFAAVGIGVAQDVRGVYYLTQDFFQPSAATPAPASPATGHPPTPAPSVPSATRTAPTPTLPARQPTPMAGPGRDRSQAALTRFVFVPVVLLMLGAGAATAWLDRTSRSASQALATARSGDQVLPPTHRNPCG